MHLHKKKHIHKKPASSECSARTLLTPRPPLASFSERNARPSEARLQAIGRGVPRAFATRSRGTAKGNRGGALLINQPSLLRAVGSPAAGTGSEHTHECNSDHCPCRPSAHARPRTRKSGAPRARGAQAPDRRRRGSRRGGDPRLPVGNREHGGRRSADESTALGTDALPQVPRPDPHVRAEDRGFNDRAPTSHAGGGAQEQRQRVGVEPVVERWCPSAERSYGQPDESLTCHQPESIPIKPRRGRTSHTPQ